MVIIVFLHPVSIIKVIQGFPVSDLDLFLKISQPTYSKGMTKRDTAKTSCLVKFDFPWSLELTLYFKENFIGSRRDTHQPKIDGAWPPRISISLFDFSHVKLALVLGYLNQSNTGFGTNTKKLTCHMHDVYNK